MSFLYAGNYNNKIYMFSDTKVSFSSITEQEIFFSRVLNNSEEKLNILKNFGIIKSVIINNNICIGFAGRLNDFNKLLGFIEEQNIIDLDAIKNKAKEINNNSNNLTDFIIASANKTKKELYLVQNGNVFFTESCSIGSPETKQEFERYKCELEIRLKFKNEHQKVNNNIEVLKRDSQRIDSEAFRNAIKTTSDDDVGGFMIRCLEKDGYFYYPEYLESNVEKEYRLESNSSEVPLFDTVENGGYMYQFFESNDIVSLYINQMKRGIRYDSCLEDIEYRYLKFPIVYNLSEDEFIKKFNIIPPSIRYG